MAVIYIFGDSVTYGAWDVEGGGWATRLRKYLDEKQEKDPDLYYLVYNLGIPGESTEGLVKRFDSEVAARSRKDEEKVFIFAYGANDSAVVLSTNQFKVTLPEFESNLIEILTKASKISSKIILLDITPLDEEVVAKETYGKKKMRLNKYVEQYNEVIARISQEQRVSLVKIYSAFMEKDYRKLFSEDGLHPNYEGHKLIFESVKTGLEKIL